MYDDFDAYLGNVIKTTRTAKGMTIRQFAERINRSHTTLLDYEKGKIPLTATMLKQMCNILDIDCAKVFDNYKNSKNN